MMYVLLAVLTISGQAQIKPIAITDSEEACVTLATQLVTQTMVHCAPYKEGAVGDPS